MNDIRDFIRYGFPGYVALAGLVVALRNAGVAIVSDKSLADHDTTASLVLLLAGPFVGFLIHQIYFVYFDWTESYDKVRRPCLRVLAKWYGDGDSSKQLDDRASSRLAYVAWKFVMTGMTPEVRVSETFLRRLSDLHNYAHSFGAIITASLFSIMFGVGSAVYHRPSDLWLVCFFAPFTVMALLFWYKRRDVVIRADIFERAAILENRGPFVDFMRRLQAAEVAGGTGFLEFSRKFGVPELDPVDPTPAVPPAGSAIS